MRPGLCVLLAAEIPRNARTASGTLCGHIEITPGVAGGKPRIAGRRITMQNVVVWHERMGRRGCPAGRWRSPRR